MSKLWKIFTSEKKYSAGFSLLEMSMVVAIIGMTIGLGILSFNQYSRLSKAELTRGRLNIILKAIDDYYDKFQKLPCPASGTVGFSANTFGLAIKDGVTDNCTSQDSLVDDTYVGVVPVNSLNIYPTYALDGWGNRFKYAVKVDGVTTGGATLPTSALTIKNYNGGSSYSEIVVLVMSHGENGFGAWKGPGGSKIADGSNTQENYNSNISADGFRVSIPQPGFDDIVYFLTGEQITSDDFE